MKDSNKTSGQLHRKHEFHAELSFLDKSVDVVPLVVVQSSQVPHAHSSSNEQNNPTPQKEKKKKNSKTKCNATSCFIISARTTTDKDTEGKASFRKISNDGEIN